MPPPPGPASAPPGQAATEHRLFVVRDADALGIILEESNGALRVRSMSLPGLGGLAEKDRILAHGLEATLTAMLNSKDQCFTLKFSSANPAAIKSRYARKGDTLARKGRFFEAAATYALVDDDDPLVTTNRCIALYLSGRRDEAFMESNRIIQLWPNWEMGYVRKAACQAALQDLHGAIRTLSQGLLHLPENPALLRRLRALIPEKEQEIICLGEESDVMLTLFHPEFFISHRFSEIFASNANDFGLSVLKTFNPLVPVGSRALHVNGLMADACLFTELRSRMANGYSPALLVVFQLVGNSMNGSSSMKNGKGFEHTSDFEERQLELRLVAIPQSFDQVVVFGAGHELCNGDFYPQGTRNERPWFENEHGVCLSYEQCESGICGWVLGDPTTQTVYYVLCPGHEPRGEDFGQWLATGIMYNPPPSFVGVGERVASLKKLTTWIKDPKIRGTSQSADTTLIPCLLGLKGHGIRLLEGGFMTEALQVFDLVIDQALALAFGDDRCSAATLGRVVESAKLYKSKALAETEQIHSSETKINIELLQEGFLVKVFEDKSRVVQIRVLPEKDSIQVFERNPPAPRSNGRRRSPWSICGCARLPPGMSTPHEGLYKTMDVWPRKELTVEVVPAGPWKMLRLSNGNKLWETTVPDENVLDALKKWAARGEHVSSRFQIPATSSSSNAALSFRSLSQF